MRQTSKQLNTRNLTVQLKQVTNLFFKVTLMIQNKGEANNKLTLNYLWIKQAHK